MLGREFGDEDDVMTQTYGGRSQARVLAHRGEHVEAERLAREAVAIAERTDALNGQGEALCDLAETLAAAGRPTRPRAALEQALDRYERKKNLAMVAQVKPKLEELRAHRVLAAGRRHPKASRAARTAARRSPKRTRRRSGRAQGRLRALLRPGRLHRRLGYRGSRGRARAHPPVSRSACGRRSSATAARWRSSSATRSWRCSARRWRTRTTPSAPSGRGFASWRRSRS